MTVGKGSTARELDLGRFEQKKSEAARVSAASASVKDLGSGGSDDLMNRRVNRCKGQFVENYEVGAPRPET